MKKTPPGRYRGTSGLRGVFRGVPIALRPPKAMKTPPEALRDQWRDEDTARGHRGTNGLQGVFRGVPMALRPTEGDEDAAGGRRGTNGFAGGCLQGSAHGPAAHRRR